MKLTRVGVDLAKQVFQVHGVDRAERPVWCQRLKRGRWITEFERNVEPGCEIGMEACGGAHHWARLLQSRGYLVKLIAPQFVKPYVKSNKNDATDGQAICEAMSTVTVVFLGPVPRTQRPTSQVPAVPKYCDNGHALTTDNLHVGQDRWRCRRCGADRAIRFRRRQ